MSKTPDRITSDKMGVREIRKHFGMKPISFVKRNCLRCDEEFLSEGKNNRMCNLCSRYAANIRTWDDE